LDAEFELHCHSTCSDGTERTRPGAARVTAARGVRVFALTDHDTSMARRRVAGARSMRGRRLSCDDGGRTIHVPPMTAAATEPLEAGSSPSAPRGPAGCA
jgi:predicted metal-dependent phosphoesterase TrpH